MPLDRLLCLKGDRTVKADNTNDKSADDVAFEGPYADSADAAEKATTEVEHNAAANHHADLQNAYNAAATNLKGMTSDAKDLQEKSDAHGAAKTEHQFAAATVSKFGKGSDKADKASEDACTASETAHSM